MADETREELRLQFLAGLKRDFPQELGDEKGIGIADIALMKDRVTGQEYMRFIGTNLTIDVVDTAFASIPQWQVHWMKNGVVSLLTKRDTITLWVEAAKYCTAFQTVTEETLEHWCADLLFQYFGWRVVEEKFKDGEEQTEDEPTTHIDMVNWMAKQHPETVRQLNGVYYFRIQPLAMWAKQHGFEVGTTTSLAKHLKDWGALKLHRSGGSVWFTPEGFRIRDIE